MAGRGVARPRAVLQAQVPQADDKKTQRALNVLTSAVRQLQTAVTPPILSGSGDPENRVSAPVGTLYVRLDGGPSGCLYVKESGGAGSAGWVAK